MLRANLSNGKQVKRGDPILVQDGGLISTAIVDKIDESDGHPYVTAIILNQTRNTLDAGQKNPTVKAGAPGYRHVSTPSNITGLRFCLIDEEEEKQLRAIGAGERVEVIDAGHLIGGSEAEKSVDSAPPPKQQFDPADRNQDGTVSKQERKQHRKENE
jgi:hypothetical protein